MPDPLSDIPPEEFRRVVAAQKNPLEIRIGDVDFATKINALGAALQAVKLAHKDELSPRSWAVLNQVEHLLGEAVFHRNDRRWVDISKPAAPFLDSVKEKCAKPGCGAECIVGQPCRDYDCPQQWVSAEKFQAALQRATGRSQL